MSEVKPWEQVPDDGYWRSLGAQPQSTLEELGPLQTTSISPKPLTDGNGASPPNLAIEPGSPRGWALAEKGYTQGDTLELRVVGYNRGGLLVDLGQVHGFVPSSQLVTFPRQAKEEERLQELAHYVNSTLRLKVIEFDRMRNRLILSERVANPIVPRVDQILASIHPQETRRGVIRNITDFGAFVDLGGVEGLIHISEFSWQHVTHPRDVVTPGQVVQVFIMDVNREQKRIACSLKRLRPNPWAQMAERLQPGDWVDGPITNIVSFGAFVRVAEGIEGLVHISELAEGSFLHPRDVVQEGQIVHARVINVDPARQRIGLSLRTNVGDKAEGAREDSVSYAGELDGRGRINGSGRVPVKTRVIREDPPPPPPPDAGYWESLAQSGA